MYKICVGLIASFFISLHIYATIEKDQEVNKPVTITEFSVEKLNLPVQKFNKYIGTPIPLKKLAKLNYHQNNIFNPGERVAVQRTSGDYTIGEISKRNFIDKRNQMIYEKRILGLYCIKVGRNNKGKTKVKYVLTQEIGAFPIKSSKYNATTQQF